MRCLNENCKDYNKDFYQSCAKDGIFSIKECDKRFQDGSLTQPLDKFLKTKSFKVIKKELAKPQTIKCNNFDCVNYDIQIKGHCSNILVSNVINCDINNLVAKVAPDTLGSLVAAKILLNGISASALKRDGKTLSEIIDGLSYICEASAVTKEDLINVSKMTLIKIFGEGR